MDPASMRTKVPSFLSDLGKATLRGIRKCPRCGTYNGTRGLSCKNKTCGTVFRQGSRHQPALDAVRILTGSPVQVYSVRQRDRGPDHRCFVELGVSETTIQTVEGTILTQLSSGRCSLPACLKNVAQGVVEQQCQHVKLALNCQAEATPLTLKSSVLNSMQAPQETKETLWQLATEPTGPLVQRVTKNVLVVKCQANQKHSLGYLHACFTPRPNAGTSGGGGHRFSCSCQTLRKAGEEEEEEEEEEVTVRVTPAARRCIHFLACLCAFASDESLAREFAHLLACDPGGLRGPVVPQLVGQEGGAAPARPRKRKKDMGGSGAQPTNPLLAPDPTHSHPRRSSLKKPAVTSALRRQGCPQLLDESQVSLSFQDWLASVTERIHQTMHYQFEGQPEPLVFHIPQEFFEALQQRISSGTSKKRLPNSTAAFVRKDALPLGTFSKYTWHITNILQVKQIFDTPELPLEITRSFIQNRDGSYEPFQCPRVEVESVPPNYGHPEKQQAIRPLELKTFLKVGNTSPTQKEPTPFIIEWVPNILPQARVGELRIRFQYGHQPATGHHQPATGHHQPTTGHHQPASGHHQPATGHHQPATGHHQPASGHHQPASGHHQPATGHHQPTSGHHQPATGHHQPATGHHQPATGHHQPATGGHQPASGHHQPATGHHQPATGHHQSASGGHQPATGHHQPASGGHQPASGHHQPATGHHQPTTGHHQPASSPGHRVPASPEPSLELTPLITFP